jgi:hypothetical protein
MQKNAIKLTNHQLKLVSDIDYPITKQQVISLFTDLFQELGKLHQQTDYPVPNEIGKDYKITKGENYGQLPYLVIDYPRIPNKDFVILMRTMFWWGKYFSFNLYIKMDAVQMIDDAKLNEVIDTLVYTGNNLWEQNLDDVAYETISNANKPNDTGYLKLSKKLSIDQYERLLDEAKVYQDWMQAIKLT